MMVCAMCNVHFELNDGVCAACPANCLECSEKIGAMVCSKCENQYVVMDDKTCSGEYQSTAALRVSEHRCTKSIRALLH